jgi:hypothetical protein
MARKKVAKKLPLQEAKTEEISTKAIWWWLVGGMIVLAIVFAIIDILKAQYFG